MRFSQYISVVGTLLFMGVSLFTQAQCAMCKTSAEHSQYAKSLNQGIEYLFLAPVVILGTVAVIWYRNRDKFSAKEH
ncbi:MAG: hypothetical protein U0T77_08695 [Chitinophagales bacterium]